MNSTKHSSFRDVQLGTQTSHQHYVMRDSGPLVP